MNEEQPISDPSLTKEQEILVASLNEAMVQKIDSELLANVKQSWRKVAMVVGLAMSNKELHITGLPDIYYSQRVRKLVESGFLEAQGNLSCMRFSEVRKNET